MGVAVPLTFETHARSHAPAPLAAAAAAAVLAKRPRAAPLALAVADLVRAARLSWCAPVPLLALEIGRARPGEAVVFAAAEPVSRETLARVVGRDCPLDLVIDDIQGELRGRPYDLIKMGGG